MPSAPPQKNAAFTISLPILDADGDLVPAAATLSGVVAGADGVAVLGAFGATATPTDEGEGFYDIALTAAQMNFDRVAGVLKTSTAGAKNTPFTIYTSVRQIDNLAFPVISGNGIDVAGGGVEVGTVQAGAITAAAFAAGAIDNAAFNVTETLTANPAAGGITTASFAAGAINAAAIGADAITDAKVAADVTIASVTGAVGSVTVVSDKTGYAIGTGGIAATAFVAGAIDAAAIAADAIGPSELAADAIDASALATDAVNEIRDAVFARAFPVAYGSHTFDELVKMMAAVLFAKCSGMATATGTFRNLDDTLNVIVATQDADGNRSAITRTP